MSRNRQPQLTTIYWRDIPAQVTARAGRERMSIKLDKRFQVAIDGAATRAGMTSADDYLSEWREVVEPCGQDLRSAVEAKRDQLEGTFSPENLRAHVRNLSLIHI